MQPDESDKARPRRIAAPSTAACADEVPEHLLELVRTIVSESGDPEAARGFDAKAWLADWLAQPNPALGGACPRTYLATDEGARILATLISRMQGGAYS
jgi:hypothetical protein